MITSTVLAAIIGLLSSMVPRILGLFEAKQKSKDLAAMQAHELKMFELQTQRLDRRAEIELRQTDALYAGEANVKAYDFARPTTGWTARLSETVRPVVTYIFVALFTFKTVATMMFTLGAVRSMGAGWWEGFKQAVGVVWDQSTADLFATILCFWFGDRMMNSRDRRA